MARSGGLVSSFQSNSSNRPPLKTPRSSTCTSSSSGDTKSETSRSGSASSAERALRTSSGDAKHNPTEGKKALQSRPPFVIQGSGRHSMGSQPRVSNNERYSGSTVARPLSARLRRSPENPPNASSAIGGSSSTSRAEQGTGAVISGSSISAAGGNGNVTKGARRSSAPFFQVASPPSSLATRTPRIGDLSARSAPCSSTKLSKTIASTTPGRQTPRPTTKVSTACNSASGRPTSTGSGLKAVSTTPRVVSRTGRGIVMTQSIRGQGQGQGTHTEDTQTAKHPQGKRVNVPRLSWTKPVVQSQGMGKNGTTRKSTTPRPASSLGSSNGCCRGTFTANANGWLSERRASSSAMKARESPEARTTLATLPNSARPHYQLQQQQRPYHMQHLQSSHQHNTQPQPPQPPPPPPPPPHHHHPHHQQQQQSHHSHQHQLQLQQQFHHLQNRWTDSRGSNAIVPSPASPITMIPLTHSSGGPTIMSPFHTTGPDGRVQLLATPIVLPSGTASTLSPQVMQSLHHQVHPQTVPQTNHRITSQTHRCVSTSKIPPPAVSLHQYIVSPVPVCVSGVGASMQPGQPVPRQGWAAPGTCASPPQTSASSVHADIAPKTPVQAVVMGTSRHVPTAATSTSSRSSSAMPMRQAPRLLVAPAVPPGVGVSQGARLDSARLSRLPGYTIGPVVGEGGFCKVRLGTHQLTSAKVAIKIIDKARLVDPADRKRVAREIKVLKRLTQGTIIQLLEVVESPSRVHVIMEYASGGSLLDYVRARKKLDESEARGFLVQIVRGLEYCHSRMVVHRDIKLENLLLDSEKNMKIIDFGLSAILTAGKKLRVHCGSPSYAAPEIVARKLYDGPPVDVWSLGVVLFAMVSGYLPFYAGSSKEDLCHKIISGTYRAPDWISDESRDLLAGMLTTDPAQRLTLVQIGQHAWIRGTKAPGLALPPPPVLVEFIPGTNEVRLDDDVLKEVEVHGLDREAARESLRRSEHNYATATYYLLALRKHYRRRKELLPCASLDISAYQASIAPSILISDPDNLAGFTKAVNKDGGLAMATTGKAYAPSSVVGGKFSVCGKIGALGCTVGVPPEDGVAKWSGISGIGTHIGSASANGVVPGMGVKTVRGNDIVILSRPVRMHPVAVQGTVV